MLVPFATTVNALNGCETVTICCAEDPPASVTVTVYVPAVKLDAVAVVCAGLVFQL